MAKKNKSPDVAWYIDGRKKPIAYSTKSDSDVIVELNWPNRTPEELLVLISEKGLIGMHEVKRILGVYVSLGQGSKILQTWNPSGMGRHE